ncbi:tripartite tricarboxylate transporter substrate binding protein [Siccirubricoccus sp. G192]|uniref:Bug family tripartite tricarboxylate transporter substrate binding protein n=1 Tax=Siccirubricoccus sp. G192 TaxID=2849651 RepID=UPI001C2C522B|nr:tripartite tricarboxylate transporter substrate binding protein [Siccirubricoccus sp. G192]MBV1796349.1 tripartite tricarboxylate transporter substrate binding protein [Siccirubricoccus sp. G192]
MPLPRRLMLGAFGAALPGALHAQPLADRPVTLVVPFPPGGSVDGVARILAQELGEQTGGTFLVENRAGGAGGAVGAASVLRARPDGTTLLLNASIHVVVPLINRNVGFDVVQDFTHVSLVADGPLLITTHPAVPANTLREFFDLVRAEPTRFNLATTGYGSAGHLCIELLKLRAGVTNEVVAYRGGGPALADLAAGNIHLLADPMLSSLPLVRGGRAKALAVTTRARSSLAPEVPTVAESGMEPLEMVSWYGLWGPKGMEPAIVAELSRRVGVVTASAQFRQRLETLGFVPRGSSPEGLRQFVEQEIAQYRPIVQAAGIRVE